MFIKTITVKGFKSYRQAVTVGPFSRGHNLVVGRNGSGKSNFFDAIRFILSDEYSSLRAEERVSLLHEGAGASSLSAYVEIVFDNSEGRLPLDKEEVVLRRMIGLKKDEYLLDRRVISRTELVNLFESAGFSSSNPYYIVQQGKVSRICAMTDAQRLQLLQEVAGTNLYDARKKESSHNLELCRADQKRTRETIVQIEKHYAELQKQKELLEKFLELDKKRKAIEYALYVGRLESAKAVLRSIEGDQEAHRERVAQFENSLSMIRGDISEMEREVTRIEPELKKNRVKITRTDEKRRSLVDKTAKLQVDVSEASGIVKSVSETATVAKAELAEAEKEIEVVEARLTPNLKRFELEKKNESDARKSVKNIESRIVALRVKANRANQFNSIEERNTHLRRNIRTLTRQQQSSENQIGTTKRDIERLERQVNKNEEKVAKFEEKLRELNERASSSGQDLSPLKTRIDDLTRKRREMGEELDDLNRRVTHDVRQVDVFESRKRAAIGYGSYSLIERVQKVAMPDLNLSSRNVIGPIFDLISVHDAYIKAAEVVAGSRLSYIVVDTDDTAARIVAYMQRKHMGRTTFAPLNCPDYDRRPPPNTNDGSVPLISKISYREEYDGILRQIFGRTMVVRSLEDGTRIASQYRVDCITLEGDFVSSRGAITGGFTDNKRSRLVATRDAREAKKNAESSRREYENQRARLRSLDEEMSRLTGQLQTGMTSERGITAQISRLKGDIEQAKRYLAADRANIPRARERAASLQETVNNAEKSIQDARDEMNTAMSSGLTSEEEVLMQNLKNELERTKSECERLFVLNSVLQKSVVPDQAELENLRRRTSEARKALGYSEAGDGSTELAESLEARAQEDLEKKQNALSNAKKELTEVSSYLKHLRSDVNDAMKRHSKLVETLEQKREEEGKINTAMVEDRESVERRYNTRAIETQKKAEAEKNIRQLGSLPSNFDMYSNLSVTSLIKKLQRTRGHLKQLGHVNRRSAEVYEYTGVRLAHLKKQEEEVKKEEEAICTLMTVLDQRKDEDIQRTFKGVSKFFSEIFSKLVPQGRARLVMLKKADASSSNEGNTGLSYSGVAMKVSFNATGQSYLLQQLSGGQKSVVALALILALQKLDPAPFYLFDEVDANLDASYRQAVASIIREQADSGTQFISTTFRLELVKSGDRWFGVTNKHKVSNIQEVAQSLAESFILEDVQMPR